MIASVDESVGRIMKKLDELGLTENTLVIFSSDNGGVGGYKGVGLSKEGITDNSPLKGGKGNFYEGGVTVPWVFRWKGHIAPGETNTTPIISIDLYPTLVEIAGADAPPDYTLDGVSLAGLLTGKEKALDRDAIYWHFPGYLGAGPGEWRTTPVGAVRSGDWKLLEFFEDGRQELYNLKDDIGEKNNLVQSQPEKARELHEKLVAWRKDVGAKMPEKNTNPTEAKQPKGKGKKNRAKRQKQAA
jgi:arylsulfatase A-like enzyme